MIDETNAREEFEKLARGSGYPIRWEGHPVSRGYSWTQTAHAFHWFIAGCIAQAAWDSRKKEEGAK